MKLFGQFVFSRAIGIPQSLFGGLVLAKYWAWFILPVFPALPTLNFMHAVGLSMFAGMLMQSHATALAKVMFKLSADKPQDADKTFAEGATWSLLMLVLVYPLALVIGYVWHLAIG